MKQLLVAAVLAEDVTANVTWFARHERQTSTATDTDLSCFLRWRLHNGQHGPLILLGEMRVADRRRREVE